MTRDRSGATSGRRSGGSVADLPAFAPLPAPTLTELEMMRRPRCVRAGQIVLCEGDHPDDIGIVAQGILRMQKTLITGRQHIVGLLVAGDLFGRVFDGPVSFDVEAATDAVVWSFARRPFESLVERSPELERIVLLNLLTELDRARDWMMILGNRKVTGRLAGFLIVLCTRFGDVEDLMSSKDGVIEVTVPISRADMAHLLGARQETISRAFHALADAGMIEIRSPQSFAILKLDALLEEAGEDGAVEISAVRELGAALARRWA